MAITSQYVVRKVRKEAERGRRQGLGSGMWAVGRPTYRWPQAKLKVVTRAKRAKKARELEPRPARPSSLVDV